MSTTVRDSVSAALVEEEHVDAHKKKQCLQTGIFDVTKRAPFLGSVLQCLDMEYTHIVPRAGIMFDVNGKKWKMMINPFWFCEMLNKDEREAVLLHEIYHVTHKHPLRAPFLKINEHRRYLMNIAMDMSINQYIKNLPSGCKSCPPKEEQFKGARCENAKCPGGAIDVNDYFDEDAKGNKTPWEKLQPMEYYYSRLVERFADTDPGRQPTIVEVEFVFQDPLNTQSNGEHSTKSLTSVNNEDLLSTAPDLKVGHRVAVVGQSDPVDNGVYRVVDLGSSSTPFKLQRAQELTGGLKCPVYVGDCAVDKHQKPTKADPHKKGWVIVGQQRAEDSRQVRVDKDPMIFEQHPLKGNGGGGEGDGPQEFDSHSWDGNAEEGEMMDATEELVKRAMQKRGLTYDKLPGHVKELLTDIEARRNELNYRQLILSAIKKHASGFERRNSWSRRSRRFGNKAPGTKNGELPFLDTYIDTSGSISIQEANDFLDIIDNFLKVGSRKCDLNLWHTRVYHSQKYKLGDRIKDEEWQSGGTCLEDTLKLIHKKQPDLAIILTDGCYCDVDVESWMNPGEHFPQCIFIISRDGSERHPLTRLGETVKIPNTDYYGNDKRLEEQ